MVKNEIFTLSKYGKLGDLKVLAELPVWERRLNLKRLADEAKQREEEMDRARAKSNSASFNRRR